MTLHTFLLQNCKNDIMITIYCVNEAIPDNINTNKYEVITYGQEAAKKCPYPVNNDTFYIEVRRRGPSFKKN